MIRSRALAATLAAFAGAQVLLAAAHVPAWPCPMLHVTGIPCPGCGLTRSTVLLLHGQPAQAISMHAFGPVVVVGLLMILLSLILPGSARRRFIDALEQIERRSAISMILLTGLVVYWLLRLHNPALFAALYG
jgi:hypothetical protein